MQGIQKRPVGWMGGKRKGREQGKTLAMGNLSTSLWCVSGGSNRRMRLRLGGCVDSRERTSNFHMSRPPPMTVITPQV